MNRFHRVICAAIFTVLTACQPVRPESELTPVAPAPATVTDAVTDTVTATAPITDAESMTGSPAPSANTPPSSTPRNRNASAGPSSTPRTDAGMVTASCPAILDPATMLDVDVVAPWEVGESRAYVARQTRMQIDGGDEAVSLASTTPLTVTVVEATPDGYVLEWHYGQTILEDTDIPVPDRLAAIFQSPLQVTFQYATDSAGSYLGLLDIEALRAQLVPLFDQLFDAIAASDPDLAPAIIEGARGVVERMLDDPANFEELFTGDTQLLHTLYGITFDDATPLVLQDTRPNMLGGPPIPSELTISPTHYDAELGCLHVLYENVADPVAARNSILEALQLQAREMGVPEPTGDDLPATLDLVDTIRIEFDLHRGWATAIYIERAVAIGDQGSVENGQLLLVE